MAPATAIRSVGLVAACDAEIDGVDEGALFRAIAEVVEGAAGERAVMPRPVDRLAQGRMLAQELDRPVEIAAVLVELLERPPPEAALVLVAAPEGEDDRQGDLAVAEII